MDTNLVRNIWKSERLVYRAITEKDQDWFFDEIDSDPVNTCLASPMVLAPPRPSKPDAFMGMWKTPTEVMTVVICLPAAQPGPDEPSPDAPTPTPTPTRIGMLRLAYRGYGSSPHNRACELGITLVDAHQRKGYGTEAINWALDWGFRHANLHSVNLGSVSYNTHAHKCYEKCGFKLEGRRRECCWHDRGWHDLLFFGILEQEWDELQRKRKDQPS